MMRFLKLFLKISAYFAVLLLTAYIVFIFYLHTSTGQKSVVRYTNDLLNSTLSVDDDVDVELSAISTNLFSYVNIENFLLKKSNDTLVYFQKASINYSLFPLLSGKLIFNSIEIDNLIANVRRDSSGAFQFDLLNFNSDTTTSSLSVSIEDMSVRNSKFQYDDRSIPIDIIGNNVYAKMSLKNNRLEIEATSHSLHTNYFKEPLQIDSIKINAAITSNDIMIDSVAIQFPQYTLTGKLNIGISDSPLTINGVLHGNGRHYSILKQIMDEQTCSFFNKKENSFFDLSLNGELTDLTVSSVISKITINSIPITHSRILVGIQKDRINFKKVDISVFHGNISADGYFSTKNESYSINIKLNNIKTESFIPSRYTNIPLRQMKITGKIQSNGELNNLNQISLSADLDISNKKNSKNDLRTKIDINDGFGNLCILHDTSSCTQLTIKLHDTPGSGDFNGIIDSLQFLTKQFNLPLMNGNVHFDGTFNWPDITAQIWANSLQYKKIPIDTAYVKLRYSDSTLTVEQSFFASADTLTNPYDINKLSTILHYDGEFSGDIDNISGKMSAKLGTTIYDKYQLDSANVLISLNHSTISIDTLSIYHNNSSATIIGYIDIKSKEINMDLRLNHSTQRIKTFAAYQDSIYLFKINADKISFENIIPFIPGLPAIDGMISLNLNGQTDSNLNNPQINLDFFALNLAYNHNTYADSVYFNAAFINNSLTVDTLQLFSQGESTSARFSFEFADSMDNRFKINHTSGHMAGKDINLKIFNPFLPSDYLLNGQISHDFEWNGNFSHPNLDGFITIQNGRLTQNDENILINDLNSHISFSDTLVNIDSILFKYNSIPVLSKGRFDIIKDTVLIDFKTSLPKEDIVQIKGYSTLDSVFIKSVISDFNLSFLNPLIPELQDLSGQLNSSIVITGAIDNSKINGNLEINYLNFEQEYVDAPVNNGNIAIRFLNTEIFIDTLNLPINEGIFSLSGDLTLDSLSLSKTNLHASINNIEIRKPDIMNLMLQKGTLNLISSKNKSLLDGKIIIGNSKIYRNLKIDDLWKRLLSKTESTYSKNPSSKIDVLTFYEKDVNENKISIPDFLKETNIDIDIENQGDLWIYNNVADLYLELNMNLSEEIINPSITGRITVKDNGRFSFLDHVFDIQKGTFEFIDPDKINPIISFTAESRIEIHSNERGKDDSYLITLLLDGPLDQMNFNLTSQPSLESSDIISLLTLGMTYSELATISNNTQSSEALKKRSGEIASLVVSQKMNNYLQKILGNEGGNINFELQGDLFNADDTRLAVNKRWGKRVTISYSTSVKDFDKQIITIEYRINDSFSVEGKTSQGQEQESSIDFKYRIKFK